MQGLRLSFVTMVSDWYNRIGCMSLSGVERYALRKRLENYYGGSVLFFSMLRVELIHVLQRAHHLLELIQVKRILLNCFARP